MTATAFIEPPSSLSILVGVWRFAGRTSIAWVRRFDEKQRVPVRVARQEPRTKAQLSAVEPDPAGGHQPAPGRAQGRIPRKDVLDHETRLPGRQIVRLRVARRGPPIGRGAILQELDPGTCPGPPTRDTQARAAHIVQAVLVRPVVLARA